MSSLLEDVPKPIVVTKQNLLLCKSCGDAHKGPKVPVMNYVIQLHSRVVKLAKSQNIVRPVGESTLGDALVALGTLQLEPNLVQAGIRDLSVVYGVHSRQVMKAELQLAEVLIDKSNTPGVFNLATRDLEALTQAEEVLHTTLDKVLKRQDFQQRYQWELASVVSNLQRIVTIFSQHPVAKKEHKAIHFLVDTLGPALGPYHPLVGTVLGMITTYYIRMSKEKRERDKSKDRNASERGTASTALFTAGEYAIRWLQCCLHDADAVLEIDSHLTLIRDEILTVLRNDGPQERAFAQTIAARIRSTLQESEYANNQQVAAALNEVDHVFSSQPAVVEHGENVPELSRRLDKLLRDMKQTVKQIKTHRNRQDGYGQMLLKKLSHIRDDAVEMARKKPDPELSERAHRICEYHDEVLRMRHSVSAEGTGDTTTQEEGKAPQLVKQNRVYESPYAFLGMSNRPDDSSASMPPQQTMQATVEKKPANPSLRATSIYVGKHTLNSAAEAYLVDLEAKGKDKATTAQLSRLLPRITQSVAKRSFNPLLTIE